MGLRNVAPLPCLVVAISRMVSAQVLPRPTPHEGFMERSHHRVLPLPEPLVESKIE